MFKPRQSEFDSRNDRLLLRHVYFKSDESSEFNNFDRSESFVDNSLIFDEIGQRAIILQSKSANNRVQQFKQPPLFDELSQRASILQTRNVHNSDQFKQLSKTFSDTESTDSELVDIIVEQPHPVKHHAVVDGETSEFGSNDYELSSPSLFESLNTFSKESRSPADPCSDQKDSSISKSLSCQLSTTIWQDKVVLANHSSQAKEVSINDRLPDSSFVEQLSRRALSRINPMFSDNNPERDKYHLNLLQLSLHVIHQLHKFSHSVIISSSESPFDWIGPYRKVMSCTV
jgi:hypothetical protein